MAGDIVTFIKELPKCFEEIGAVVPSSRALSKKMVAAVERMPRPGSILEVGPGTGPFTRQILKLMRPGDDFTICEANLKFAKTLCEDILPKEPAFEVHKNNIHFSDGPVQGLPRRIPGKTYDVIVSSLPFNNFNERQVADIFQVYRSLLNERGTLTFVEYIGIRAFGSVFRSQKSRTRMKGVDKVVRAIRKEAREQGYEKTCVSLFNIPPALVVELSFPASHARAPFAASIDPAIISHLHLQMRNGGDTLRSVVTGLERN